MIDGFAKVVTIIKKDNKSADEIAFIRAFLSKIKFFAQMFEQFKASPEILNGICTAVKLESYPKYQIVFKQGDAICTKAYVILRGTVMVYMRNRIDIFPKSEQSTRRESDEADSGDANENDRSHEPQNGKKTLVNFASIEQQNKRRSLVNRLLIDSSEEIEGITRSDVSDKDFQSAVGKQFGKMLLEIAEGSIFGEKALIENKPRAATICTKTPCELLILNKEDFEVIQHRFNRQQQEKKEFLMNQFPFLGTLVTSARVFERVIRFFDEENTQKNVVIFREGEVISDIDQQKIYMIVAGEVNLYRNAVKPITNPKLLHRETIHPVHVATIGPKEMFGEELLNQWNGTVGSSVTYAYTAVCTSSASKFFSVNLTAVRMKLPDQIYEYIAKTYRLKKSSRQNTFNEYVRRNLRITSPAATAATATCQSTQSQQQSSQQQQQLEEGDTYVVEKSVLNRIHDSFRSGSPSHEKNGQTPTHGEINIHGNSNTYDKFVLSQVRMNVQEKLIKEAGQDKDVVIEKRDYLEMQELSSPSQQLNTTGFASSSSQFVLPRMHGNIINTSMNTTSKHSLPQRVQAYPFKITANPRYFQQLEENMKSKNFQYADTQRIMQATRALHFPEEAVYEEAIDAEGNEAAYGEAGKERVVANKGKFHDIGRIKTHGILKRIAVGYTPHEEYYAKEFNTCVAEEAASYNAKRLFKFYEQSRVVKDVTLSRKVLSKSPEQRQENRLLAGAPSTSIPSTKHKLVNNHTHVNQQYFSYKSDAIGYNKGSGGGCGGARSLERLGEQVDRAATVMVLVGGNRQQQSEVKYFSQKVNSDKTIVQLRLHSPIRQYIYQQNKRLIEQSEAERRRINENAGNNQDEGARFQLYAEVVENEKNDQKRTRPQSRVETGNRNQNNGETHDNSIVEEAAAGKLVVEAELNNQKGVGEVNEQVEVVQLALQQKSNRDLTENEVKQPEMPRDIQQDREIHNNNDPPNSDGANTDTTQLVLD